MIEVELVEGETPLIVVTFSGEITLDEITHDRRFGDLIKSFDGAPFRVLMNFANAETMAPDVSDVFMRAQQFAVDQGMARDAFVCSSATQRFQLSRIARDNPRAERLGPLRYFETIEEARAHLDTPD